MQDIMDHWISPPNTEITVFSVSLGMVVIDEIRLPSRAPMIDVAGGSAIYGTGTPNSLGHYLRFVTN